MRRTAFVVAIVATLVAGTTACSEPLPEKGSTTDHPTTQPDTCPKGELLACAADSTLADVVPDHATRAHGEPVVLGMINQENTPAGSYPELSQAVEAGVRFINDQLGGVGGRPLRVDVCNTEFSAEGSARCAQRFVDAGVPAVLGGIDVFGNGIEVLADNDIPYVGGIPISDAAVTSPNSFQWSGGTWGAAVAFADYATRVLHAKRIAIVYGEFGPIADGAEMGKKVAVAGGAEVSLVPYPIMATDISSALNAAAATEPDALVVLAADSGCKAGFDGIAALHLEVDAFYVGACAAPSIIEAAGPGETEGAYFNVEGEVGDDRPNDDFGLYASVLAAYGPDDLDPVGAGTVSYRALMNLWLVLHELDDPTAAAITQALQSKVDAPSYSGHPYTCDGKQFAGLPAMCSPQQIIVQMQDGTLEQRGTWIDVGARYADS